MLYPPLNKLTEKVNSQYLIATTAAKRARELQEEPDDLLMDKYVTQKTVGRALEEIASGKIVPERKEVEEER
ncbi:DNA-directed RNA polymerase subunit omega [Staphylococcus massiliensis]|uniref:DNA-directed RNA polymerase subunit omega n=1 Tax=Staphylococcus massiliensis S46 TaxID=1229783 RepID=K9B9L0_9STAP|nr:DNA-directed RNA polymerase subunit omega [Staphylococcus massiliensis]EKU50410.1 DNA-directed RNA polymerase subunit omega [Staphylococcus massiliensis S46]MCG3398819.1 DNA-directed RNA polymerase subunit omega [Staphylococcus massiliensis]MCG3401380.1 DNA-directed RNA polymerase subunit omega [Staphylococcus massiliensis]MCG3411838.1 DNA-directed RNA polymerase subunit omega [Staphylococcus massiliensis]POA00513.1 DNA-directed RNA polymerase subunit omega [Staphylococcus massiliensis CCUG